MPDYLLAKDLILQVSLVGSWFFSFNGNKHVPTACWVWEFYSYSWMTELPFSTVFKVIVTLQIIGEISVAGATYKSMEFVGSTVESLTVSKLKFTSNCKDIRLLWISVCRCFFFFVYIMKNYEFNCSAFIVIWHYAIWQMEECMTLCNMVVKAGGKNGVVPADATTFKYLEVSGLDHHMHLFHLSVSR